MRTDLFQKLREVLMGDGGPFPFNALMRGLELGGFNDSFGQPAIGRQDTKIGVPQIGIVHRFKQDFGHCSSEAGCTALSLKGPGQIALIIQWVIIVAALAVWAISQIEQVLNSLLMLWGLVICLIYAIFAGWIMKISHLRKAMNFSTELFYNLWRIAVRVVLPLAIVLAMLSLLGQQL